jgi:hypothetical protein
MVPGAYATAPVIAAWISNNSEPYYRRATSIALGFVATNAVCGSHSPRKLKRSHTEIQGGILSTWRYPSKEGPKFRKTTIMNLILCVCVIHALMSLMILSMFYSTIVMILLAIINALTLSYANKRKKEKRTEILAPFSTEKEPDGGVAAWVELGDRHPDFRYVT